MKKFEIFIPLKTTTQIFGVNPQLYAQFGIKGHNGIDYALEVDRKIFATHDGEIVYAGTDNNEGKGIVIRTTDQFEYNSGLAFFKTIYWHLESFNVKVGDKVKAGDFIGIGDNTGFSTGPHLHFGLKPQALNEENWTWWNIEQNNGYAGAIDPYPYFNGYYSRDAQKVIGIMENIIKLLKVALEFFTKK